MTETLERQQEAYRLLEQVVACSPAARESLLATAPEELRAEVLALLSPGEDSLPFLDGPHPLLQETASSAPLQLRSIGPYRILDLLGEGGMGQVYLAEQDEPVRRQVALKVLRTAAPGAEAAARFRTERNAMARLDHPNVGRILEAGATEDGRPYFVMERIEGVAIAEYCDREALPLEERVRLFVAVCRGTEHAHQKLLLHRDLKPSNVLVTEVDGRPTPRIIDFGLAKYLDETAQGGLTGDRMLGTPAYMSPEALGMGGDVDTRSDVFSLGVLLYELLTGVSPWDGGPRTPLEMLRYRSEAEPRRPSTRLTKVDPVILEEIARRRRLTPASLAAGLRGDLEHILMKAIAREPERRYGSAAELGADLERFLLHEPVTARPPRALYLLRKAMSRHRGLVTAAALLAAVLLAGVVGTAVGLIRARHAEEQALVDARQAIEARNEARAVSDFLRGIFHGSSTVSPVAPRPPSEISALELLQRGSRRIEEELADQPLLAARLQATLGDVYRTLNLFDEAKVHLDRAVANLEEAHSPSRADQALLARILRQLAQVAERQARWDDARHQLRRARDLSKAAIDEPELSEFEATLLDLESWLTRREGRFDAAESQLKEAALLLNSVPEPDSGMILEVQASLGSLYFEQERWAEAEAEFRRSLAVARRLLPPGDFRTAQTLDNVAAAVASQGRLDEAAPFFTEALELKRLVLSEDHPLIAISLNNLGRLQLDLGRPELAEPLHREALALRRKTRGANHPETAWSLDNLARTVDALGRPDEARELQEEALSIRQATLGEGHPQIARSLAHLAELGRHP